MHRFQPLDGGEQAQRATRRTLRSAAHRQPASAAMSPCLMSVDDQHFGAAGIIERAFGLEVLSAWQVQRAGARLGGRPASPPRRVAEVTSTPSAGAITAAGQRLGRVEPAAVDGDVIFAPVDALDCQPVDESRVRLAADPAQQARSRRLASRAATPGRGWPVHPRPRLRIEPVGRVLQHRFEPPRQRRQGFLQRFKRLHRGGRLRHQRAVGNGQLGLQPVAGLLPLARA
jgi:hypothetical protein